MATSSPTLPSTNPNDGGNTTEHDVFISSSPRGVPQGAPVDPMIEHRHYAAIAERQAQLAEQRARMPDPVAKETPWHALVPPGLSYEEGEAYLSSMIEKAGGAENPRDLNSADIGRLPIDPGILRNPLSPNGFPRSVSELTDDCTVEYSGTSHPTRMSVAQAIREGLLERDANGRLTVPDAGARAQQEAQQAQQEAQQAAAQVEAMRQTGDAPDAEASKAIDIAARHVPAPAISALAHDFIQNGSLSLQNVERVSQRLGWTAAQGQALAVEVVEGLSRQATAAAVHAGVPADKVQDLWHWAAKVDPVEHATASMALVHNSDATGLKRLAKAYLASLRDVEGARR